MMTIPGCSALHRAQLAMTLSFLLAWTCAATAQQLPGLDVPYVPTPGEVVDKMLEVAKVNRNDTLYDLGCGDSRIVVTAARKFGARGTGIDTDPQRIEEARANAKTAGVEDKVEFRVVNLFETDVLRPPWLRYTCSLTSTSSCARACGSNWKLARALSPTTSTWAKTGLRKKWRG